MRVYNRGVVLVVLLALLGATALLALPGTSSAASAYYWTQIRANTTLTNLNALTATDTDHVWIAGGSGANGHIAYTPDGGQNWTEYTETGNYLGGIFGIDNTHVWAVGDNGSSSGRILCHDGSDGSWDPQNVGAPAKDYRMNAVAAVNQTQVWAGGRDRATNNGRIIYSNGGAYNSGVAGTEWVDDWVDTTGKRIVNIAAADANNVWACAYEDLAQDRGYVLKRFGANDWRVQLTVQDPSGDRRLNGIYATDANHVWAVGDAGTIYVSSDGGDNWTNQTTAGLVDGLKTVTAVDSHHAWAGGNGGVIYGYLYDDAAGAYAWKKVTVGSISFKGSGSPDKDHVFMGAGSGTNNNVYRGEPPRISGCTPPSAVQGKTVDVQIEGTGTCFVAGDSAARFSGSGITVNSTTVIDGTHAKANITVAGNATVGSRDVNFVTGGATPETPDPLVGAFQVIYNPDAPVIDRISPASGPVGASVTVTGRNFGHSRGSSKVSFNGVDASAYTSWGDTRVKCRVPAGASSGSVTIVTPGGGTSNAVDFQVTYSTFYFAEGSCRPGFDTYFCIQNGGEIDADVKITYMLGDGTGKTSDLTVPARSRATVEARATVGEADDAAHDFSAKVETTNQTGIVVERPMYFNYKGAWTGGHDVFGVTGTATDYYFAEGTCRPNFEPYLCIQNPTVDEAQVKITYMRGSGAVEQQELAVGAGSRATVEVRKVLGSTDDSASDFSAHVQSTNGVGIIAERPTYFNYNGFWTGGHDVVGATATSDVFYFAEGSTRPGLDPYFCIQNPGTESTDVKITYLFVDGTAREETVTVPATSRYTVDAKKSLGSADDPKYDFSAKVESVDNKQILAERPMYFQYKGAWTGGHDVIGATAPATGFRFAEGTCRPDFEPYFCLLNPGTEDAEVAITYYLGTGDTRMQKVMVPAGSRSTVVVKELLGEGDDPAHDFSANVEAMDGAGIIAERPMYFNYHGAWTGGHDVVGFTR